jgi:hypothetical protein
MAQNRLGHRTLIAYSDFKSDFNFGLLLRAKKHREGFYCEGIYLPLFILEDHLGSYMEHYMDFLPLQNLLTLSFDDEHGFRGAGHRHDPVQHMIIAADEASPGLIPGIVPRGQLRLMINVHCVVSEECRYQLHVWEKGEVK